MPQKTYNIIYSLPTGLRNTVNIMEFNKYIELFVPSGTIPIDSARRAQKTQRPYTLKDSDDKYKLIYCNFSNLIVGVNEDYATSTFIMLIN